MARGDARPDLIRAAALRLFAAHGVAGTSLQMIADELGVSKAAVYHHHQSKHEIVRVVLAPALVALSAVADAGESESDPRRRLDVVIAGLADQAIAQRALWSVLLRDVTVAQLAADDEVMGGSFVRVRDLLRGPEPTSERLTRVGLFMSGLMAPAGDPDLAAVPDDDLRAAIVDAGHRLLDD